MNNTLLEVKKPDLRFRVIISVSGFVTLIILALLFQSQAGWIIFGMGSVGVMSFGVSTWLKYQFGLHQIKRLKAETVMIEEKAAQAKVITEQMRLQARIYETKSGVFMIGLSDFDFVPTTAAMQRKLLPAGISTTDKQPLDLITVFSQPTQSYACIGGQQTGKTYQMRHIAQKWLESSRGALGQITPIVIGPKWDRGEWAGCQLFGGNGNFERVETGLKVVKDIVNDRHASNKPHKSHDVLPIFFDDWTQIVSNVEAAKDLIFNATTLYASVNVLLYFIIHSDTSDAWGVDKKGAALKDNFIKLFLVPHYNQAGLIVREDTRGYITFPGDKEEYPTRLFNLPFPTTEINEDDKIRSVIAQLGPEVSNREISQAVWGEGCFGSWYNEKIDRLR
jgi:hypothetical protein